MCSLCANLTEIESHRRGVIEYVNQRCRTLLIESPALAGIILDSWHNDQKANKTLRIVRAEFPTVPIIVLQGLEDFHDIHNASVLTNADGFETLYLRSLKRARIRELVHTYLEEAGSSLDEDLVANKLIEDIDCLNMHRTPLNCLLLMFVAVDAAGNVTVSAANRRCGICGSHSDQEHHCVCRKPRSGTAGPKRAPNRLISDASRDQIFVARKARDGDVAFGQRVVHGTPRAGNLARLRRQSAGEVGKVAEAGDEVREHAEHDRAERRHHQRRGDRRRRADRGDVAVRHSSIQITRSTRM